MFCISSALRKQSLAFYEVLSGRKLMSTIHTSVHLPPNCLNCLSSFEATPELLGFTVWHGKTNRSETVSQAEVNLEAVELASS